MSMHPLPLDELPKHTIWPEKLLSATTRTLFEKDRAAIYREYESDKWARLWADIQANQLRLDDIETMQFSGKNQIAISVGSELFLTSPIEARRALASSIADEVFACHAGNSTIAELGAGTGAIIIRIAKDPRFTGSEFAAGDFSPSSIKLIKYLSEAEGVLIRTGLFDFHGDAPDLSLPPDCTIFFSFAIAYVQDITDAFWARIFAMRPKSVLIAEPIYQFFRHNSLLGLLRRRYCEANDYNRHIFPSIESAQRKGVFAIAGVKENVIGINPLCPVSLISLCPK